MSAPYSGNKDAVQTPSAALAPGATVTASLVQDADGNTTANMYQSWKVPFDGITYLLGSSRPDFAVTNATGTGFTAPVYVGFGGTVTPSGSAHIADGTRFMIQIQTGGAVGVATFKTSIDGGTTYGALQTTSASMTDVTSGITLAFVGTLTAAGTAGFKAAFTPLAQWNDQSGNARSAVDHLGYMNPRNLCYKEYWQYPTGVNGTATVPVIPIANVPAWVYDVTVPGIGGQYQLGIDATASLPFAAASVVSAQATINADAWIGHYACLIYPHANLSASVTWYGKINSVGATNCTQYVGMGGGSPQSRDRWVAASNAFTDGIFFSRATGQANWQCNSMAASVTTTVDSGVAATTSLTKFGMELIGASSPTGPCARFFINGALVATIATNLPTTALKFAWGNKVAGSASATDNTHFIGPLFISANYEASVPLL